MATLQNAAGTNTNLTGSPDYDSTTGKRIKGSLKSDLEHVDFLIGQIWAQVVAAGLDHTSPTYDNVLGALTVIKEPISMDLIQKFSGVEVRRRIGLRLVHARASKPRLARTTRKALRGRNEKPAGFVGSGPRSISKFRDWVESRKYTDASGPKARSGPN